MLKFRLLVSLVSVGFVAGIFGVLSIYKNSKENVDKSENLKSKTLNFLSESNPVQKSTPTSPIGSESKIANHEENESVFITPYAFEQVL